MYKIRQKLVKMIIRDLPEEIRKQLKLISVKEGISMNKIIINLITQYVKEKGE